MSIINEQIETIEVTCSKNKTYQNYGSTTKHFSSLLAIYQQLTESKYK